MEPSHTRHRRLPEPDDTFGWSLATGNLGRDHGEQPYDDLALRVPGETTTSSEESGALTIIYGSRDGLTATGSQTLTHGFSSEATGIDVDWRRQLTATRSADSGLDQLIVGDEDWIQVLPASPNGLHTAGQRWTAKSLGHPQIWFGLADKVTG